MPSKLLATLSAVLLLILLTGCTLTILVDGANPFEVTPTATAAPEYRIIGYIQPKNSVLNIRGCRIVNDAVCQVVRQLKAGERLPVVDMVDPAYTDVDPDWYYVSLEDGLAFAWAAKYASKFESVR